MQQAGNSRDKAEEGGGHQGDEREVPTTSLGRKEGAAPSIVVAACDRSQPLFRWHFSGKKKQRGRPRPVLQQVREASILAAPVAVLKQIQRELDALRRQLNVWERRFRVEGHKR